MYLLVATHWHKHGTAPILQEPLSEHSSFGAFPWEFWPSWPFTCPVTAIWPWLSSLPSLAQPWFSLYVHPSPKCFTQCWGYSAAKHLPTPLMNELLKQCVNRQTPVQELDWALFPPSLACDLESPTSSLIPVSRSIITQASIGTAISRPLRLRCSSRGVPKAGFSVHLSKLESIKTLSRISTKPSNYSPGKKRRKLLVQHRNVQTTAGVLQPLIGKVPWIMCKGKMRLLVVKKNILLHLSGWNITYKFCV